MKLTICGHAGVLVESGDARYLVDPVFGDTYASGSMAFHPARSFELEKMPRPTAIVVTHAHIDHFDPPSLERLPKDVPIIVPPDGWLEPECKKLGFREVIVLDAWRTHTQGELTLTATPSDFDWDELGLLFTTRDASYWHMSDSVVKREVGARILREHGPITALAARYQPVQVLPGYMRGLGNAFDERAGVIEWLEAGASTEPAFVFPYAWAVAYVGRHAWANRFLGPWSQPEIVRLFERRLPGANAAEVRPGDMLELRGREVQHHRARAEWVREKALQPSPEAWEPIDATTLGGVPLEERAGLVSRARALIEGEVLPFLASALAAPDNPFHNYARWGVVWQAAIHLGDGERFEYVVDFRDRERLTFGPARHADANLFTHLSGDALAQVLDGRAGTELFWMSGDVRQYEKILFVEDGQFRAPPLAGWALFDALPDPITVYLRKFRAR